MTAGIRGERAATAEAAWLYPWTLDVRLPVECWDLTVECEVNFVAPVDGNRLIARARVVRPGRTLVVVSAEAFVVRGGREQLCATALATIMLLPGKVEGPAPEKRGVGFA